MKAAYQKELEKHRSRARGSIPPRGRWELEAQLARKEHFLLEQKYLEGAELQAGASCRPRGAGRRLRNGITQLLELEVLDLCSRLEKDGLLRKREVEKTEAAEAAAERLDCCTDITAT